LGFLRGTFFGIFAKKIFVFFGLVFFLNGKNTTQGEWEREARGCDLSPQGSQI